jgi:hypothetical protein
MARPSNADLRRLVGLAIEGYWTDPHAQPQREDESKDDYLNRVSLALPLAEELLAILGDAL